MECPFKSPFHGHFYFVIVCGPVLGRFGRQMDSCHTWGHIKVEEGGLLFTVARGNSLVPQCPFSCRLSLETLISRAVMTEPEWELCGEGPLGAPWRVTMPVDWSWQEEGYSGLESAGDMVGAENLSSGAFSPDQMSTLHARVYIASGNKLWGNLTLFEGAGWLSSHSGSPVASHQATVPPLLRVCITSSTVLNHPSPFARHCEACPTTLRFHRHRC